MTPAERQKLWRDRIKAGLVRVEVWVPAKSEAAVRAAIDQAVKDADSLAIFANRPLPDYWRAGQRIRYIRSKEHCCDAGALGVVLGVEHPERPASEDQVIYTRPDGWNAVLGGSARFYTTPDEVELVQE